MTDEIAPIFNLTLVRPNLVVFSFSDALIKWYPYTLHVVLRVEL